MKNFEQKSVSTPMLDATTKAQLGVQPITPTGSESPTSGSDKKGFITKNKWYIGAGVLAVIVIGVLAAFAFRGDEPLKEANVVVTIDAPEGFPSSGDVVVKVGIENQDSQSLVGMELEMVYPEGVTYASSTPKAKNLSGTLFAVPDLLNGQNALVLLKLRSQGSVGELKKVTARLRYKYPNISSGFLKETTTESKVVSSKLTLDLQGPNSTNNTQLVTYIVKYVNNDDKALENGRIELAYPRGFAFSVAEPAPTIGKNIWNIGSLEAHRSGEIKITGTFQSATPGETQVFGAEYSVLDPSGTYHTQATASYSTQIASLPLLVTQELDGHSNLLVAAPGETLVYTITYQNNATFAAKSVNIVLAFDSKAIDTNSIQAEGAQINGNTVTWNASSDSNLDIINPNEGGSLRISLKVKNPPVKDSTKNIDIKSTVKIKSAEYETYLPGNNLQVKIASLARIEHTLEHISGPLPPKVGQATVYKVTLLLHNLTNDFTDAQLIGSLALSPSSFDKASVTPTSEVSKLQFDSGSGKITWNVGQLRAHTGDFSQPKAVSFMVRLNPSSSQVGEAPVLIKDINLAGTDSFTEQPVRLQGEDITTDDLSDGGYDKGRVVE